MGLAKVKCMDCNIIFIADTRRWHMDYCPKCKKNAVDLEEYYGRLIGNIKSVEDFEPNIFESDEEYHSALLGWINDSDEEYTLYKIDRQLILEKLK